jgi:O-Antigen ligase/Lysylphosphatidylglycerol synthase TM region
LAAAIALLSFNYDLSKVVQDLGDLTFPVVAIVSIAMLSNVIFAAARFKIIAGDMGNAISWRGAIATVSASSLAGALFFQLAGQLIARSAIMSRSGVPLANVVVITLYERVVAAVLSGLMAVTGAYFLFGRVYIDPAAGGADLIRLVIGLIAATTVGALVGYGRNAVTAVLPLLSERFVRSLLSVFAVTLFVQLPIMVAYVAMAHALSPGVALVDLVAASTVVMFAASVPISLAGWGVREMSAVAALGLIGVSGHAAFATAITVGVGSLVSMAIAAAISLPGLTYGKQVQPNTSSAPKIDYTTALSWALPLAAATFVLFQVYLPVGSGLLNVNLADPLALIGAALLIAIIRQTGRPTIWRVPHLNMAVVLTTAALTISLFVGIGSFGYTTWAWLNRYLGWFVLLAYGATGALIVVRGGEEGRRAILLTYVGATIAVGAVDFGTLVLRLVGIDVTKKYDLEAFSQNHNFFAFQLLMALSAIFVMVRGRYLRIVLISIALAAFWFAGSRSGWVALLCVTGAGLYLKAVSFREISVAVAIVVVAVCLPSFEQVVGIDRAAASGQVIASDQTAAPDQVAPRGQLPIGPMIIPSVSSTTERIFSLTEGWKLFKTAPLFGAGLGAFRNLGFEGSTAGIPLLIHSTALWLLAELGVVGFLIFAVPFMRVFRWELNNHTEAASAVSILCLVGFAVMSGPADMLYQRTFWLLMGAALACRETTDSSSPRSLKVR